MIFWLRAPANNTAVGVKNMYYEYGIDLMHTFKDQIKVSNCLVMIGPVFCGEMEDGMFSTNLFSIPHGMNKKNNPLI